MTGRTVSTPRESGHRADVTLGRGCTSRSVSRDAPGHDVEIAITFTPEQPIGSTQVLVDGDNAELVAPAHLLALLDALRDRLDVYTADYRRAMRDDDDEPGPDGHDEPPAGGGARPASRASMTWDEAGALAYREEDRWPSDLLDLNSDGMAA